MIWVKFGFPEVSRDVPKVVSEALILQPGVKNFVPVLTLDFGC